MVDIVVDVVKKNFYLKFSRNLVFSLVLESQNGGNGARRGLNSGGGRCLFWEPYGHIFLNIKNILSVKMMDFQRRMTRKENNSNPECWELFGTLGSFREGRLLPLRDPKSRIYMYTIGGWKKRLGREA